ncbi:hypothetical protein Agub_g2111 [Astrephomene gubernaculifera]|uniref:Uncharacterized protein n=1 Tax=Astrephomene gubernaculifera TaxID=47775 RepID=A0AAD3DGK6_9CHLO|nr:hypothetical protein Agub_g2111 [Astrephomene gubernaculifera]
MRTAANNARRLVAAAQFSPRCAVSESNVEIPNVFIASGGLQAAQMREFSSPMFRPRPFSGPSWQHEAARQATANLTSTTSSLAAAAAWQASVVNAESSQVEDWLAALHQIDSEARGLCSGLLSRNPTLLWKDPTRTAGVVQAIVDAIRQKHLLRPYFMQDAHVLALADRYTPEGLRARLSELHRLVWQKLDDADVTSLFASRTSLDMLDLDAKALALKAQALRALVPEFLPSTILRSCPELLDVQVDDLPSHVRRAGDTVILGANVHVQLSNNMVTVRTKVLPKPSPTAQTTSSAASTVGTAIAGRLLRTARCGAQQLLKEHDNAVGTTREVVREFSNGRQLIYAAGEQVEIRFDDPDKAQEATGASCRMTAPQSLATAAKATAGYA